MHWADKIAKEIISSNKYRPYWVDDMTTPSGYSHIGSIRGPIIHYLIYKVLLENGEKAKNTYVFNDFDPIDGLPPDLVKDFSKYLGFPLRSAPSPVSGSKSFGEYFSNDFKKVLLEFGIEAEFLSSWDLYHQGKFDEVIKIALDKAEKIQDIYKKISGSAKKEKGWLPFQVICENCGKLGTTRVFAWDGKVVSYKCEPSLVTWAKGCGHTGTISPFGGTGKLPWKVDWPAHWKVMGVTIEGAGKDHASAGGSYDIAMELCKEVFDYPQPYKLPYEHFLLGGKKMSSSMGIGLKARDWTSIVPASVGRFLFVRTDYKEAINFDPVKTMVIPDLFDEYDKAAHAYWEKSDENLARIFELSQIKKEISQKMYLPRFRDVVQVIQMPDVKAEDYFADKKGEKLTKEEKDVLEERIKYAKNWLANYAPEELKFQIATSSRAARISGKLPAEFYQGLVQSIEGVSSPEELEKRIYQLIKESNLSPKDIFPELYSVLIGKNHGPKLAWLIWENKEKAVKLLKEASK